MTDEVTVSGFALDEFEPMVNAFARIAGSLGGQTALAVYRDGTPVVNLVSGAALAPWQVVFSVSKAVTAIAAEHASASGLLDLDAPIADCWSAFSRSSTAPITTRMVLSHRSGLPAVAPRLSIEDLLNGRLEEALETQEPYWRPGADHGYHTLTFGALLDGIFVRSIGQSVAEYVERHLAAALSLDLKLGVPQSMVQKLVPHTRPRAVVTEFETWFGTQPGAIADGAGAELWSVPEAFNRTDVIAAGWPGSNVVCTATDLARLFAATLHPVDGVRLLSGESIDSLTRVRSAGPDRVLGFPIAFGSGIQRPFPQCPFLGPSSFGHEGANGCVAFADPHSGLAVGFTTTVHPSSSGASPGATALFSSLRQCLETSR